MTEEALMMLVKSGALENATALFDLYNKRLYNFFVRITYDRDLGHDLTQNVFLRLIRFRHTYKEGSKFQSWIFQIARNVYADHYRKHKVLKDNFVDVENIRQKIAAIDENIIKNEKEKQLHFALAKLKIEEREIIVLSKFQEMKYEEIAALLDCSLASVKVKVHRALKELKTSYFLLEE